MRRRFRPLPFAFAASAVAALLAASCLNDSTGPASVPGVLALQPAFASGAAGLVDIDRARVLIVRNPGNVEVVDSIHPIAPGASQIDLQFDDIPITSPEDVFILTLSLISPLGDTVFRFGPGPVEVFPPDAVPEPTPVSLDYVGPGSEAAGVEFVTSLGSLFFGEAGQVTAQGVDEGGEPLPEAPVRYNALDPAMLVVLDDSTGEIQAQSVRGPARVEAELLTGQTDTVTIMVQPVADALVVISGSNQTGTPGLPLLLPVVVEVRAADGLGVQDVEVQFDTPDGGSFSPMTATSDVDGLVSTTWTLGTSEGTQNGSATLTDDPGVQTAFTAQAMGTAPTPQQVRWINGSGGSWTDPANWDAGRVPLAEDTAVIDLGATFAVALTTPTTVASLVVGGGATGVQALQISGAVLTSDGDITVLANGSLSLVDGTITGMGTITSSGPIGVTGTSVSVITNPIDQTGPTDVLSGSLSLQGGGTIAGSSTISTGSDLDFTQGTFTLGDYMQSGGGVVSISTGTLNVAGTATVENFVMVGGTLGGAGELNVTTALSWTGGTMTDAGLTIAEPTASVVLTPTTGTTLAGGRTFENNGTMAWTGGALSASEGAVLHNLGSLFIQADAAFVFPLPGPEPTLDNEGILHILAGTLDVNGAFTNRAGGTVMGVGTLDIDGATTTLDGTIAPGASPGTLTVIGGVALSSTATLAIEINGAAPGTEHDVLNVQSGTGPGAVTLDGTLAITVDPAFTPVVDQTFRVLDAVTATGVFATITGASLTNGMFLDTVTDVELFDVLLVVRQPGLEFVQQPSNILPFQPIAPGVTVQALDALGNPDATFNGDVTIAIGSNPGGGTALGTLTVTAVSGVATFPDLSVDALGTGYTLTASATDRQGDESGAFDVVPGIAWVGDSLTLAPLGLFSTQPDGTERINPTTEGPTDGSVTRRVSPRWSPDRMRLTYSARATTGVPNQLHVTDPNTRLIAHLNSDTSTFQPRYNSTGEHIAFICGDGSEFTDQDVCVVTGVNQPVANLEGIADGAGKAFVTDPADVQQQGGQGAYAWDPTNPDQLAVVRNMFGSREVSEIFVVDIAGNVVESTGTLVTAAGDSLIVFEMDWSPDGSFFVFSAEGFIDFTRALYRVDRDGANLTQLTFPANDDDDLPVISPDGSEVLFLRNDFAFEGSMWQYFRVPSAGGGEVAITPQNDFFLPSTEPGHDWSPDGTEIVLVDLVGVAVDNWGLWIVPSTTTETNYTAVRRLVSSDTGTDRQDGQPSWRP